MTKMHRSASIFCSRRLGDLRERPSVLPMFAVRRDATDLMFPSYDYTKGKVDELISIIIDSGAKLFVSAVGVPPKAVVDRLHKHGILYMNMIGEQPAESRDDDLDHTICSDDVLKDLGFIIT